ncbi:hypothetical protein [Marivirga sp.]|uniref:hypothetical protein n=1 Tax=Marivirga sp. TaxID=2018662 RepID=UPI003DA6F724
MTKLKDKLIEEIKNSQDKELLEEIYQVLCDKGHDEIVHFSDTQIESIKKAQQEVGEGKYFTQEQIDDQLDQWLEE